MLFIPNISQNLLSVSQLIKNGFNVIFETNQCLIKDVVGNDVFRVKMKGKSFTLDTLENEQTTFSATKIHEEV